jgi:hypothetical protein
MGKAVAVLVFDGFADWEPAFALTGLRRWAGKTVTTVGYDRAPVAVICGATIAATRAGLFRGRRHTSNGRGFLRQHAPDYDGEAGYVDALAVTDDGVISASGLGAIEFAREIFAALGVFSAETLDQYIEMYRGGRQPAA